EVLRRVVGERLRKVDPSVVDEQVDALEVLHGSIGYLRGRRLLGDVSVHEDETRRGLQILRVADRARIGDDTIATLEKRTGDPQADAARSAGDDSDTCSHGRPSCELGWPELLCHARDQGWGDALAALPPTPECSSPPRRHRRLIRLHHAWPAR